MRDRRAARGVVLRRRAAARGVHDRLVVSLKGLDGGLREHPRYRPGVQGERPAAARQARHVHLEALGDEGYRHVLRDDPAWADVDRVERPVKDVSGFLAAAGAASSGAGGVERWPTTTHAISPRPARAHPAARAAARIPGIELVAKLRPNSELCSGSTGVSSMVRPEPQPNSASGRRATSWSTGAEAVVTGNPRMRAPDHGTRAAPSTPAPVLRTLWSCWRARSGEFGIV